MQAAYEVAMPQGKQEDRDDSASPWLGHLHPTLDAGSLWGSPSPAGWCGRQRAHLSSEEGL